MFKNSNSKPKILIHYVMPGSTGGPNILFNRIEESRLLKDKYEFVRLNQTRVAGGRINISLILELRKKIVEIQPDLIHISGMQSAGFHCMIAAVLAGCKNRLITTHGFSGDDLSTGTIKRAVFNMVIEPLTLKLARHVHCISMYTYNKPMVSRYAMNKRTCIYNFPPRDTYTLSNRKLRKELNISDDEVVFTSVSRIVLDKGYEQLAKAISSTELPKNIRFILVGDGNYEDTLKCTLKDEIESRKVIMLGKRNDVMDILNESDVFILPTLHENLGNVFLEAGFLGLPSIATKVGGVPEIIIDGVTGLLVEPYDVQALILTIQKMSKDKEFRSFLGRNALQRVNEVFSTNKIEKEFLQLYSSLIR